MTVEDNYNRPKHNCNGSVTEFAFQFGAGAKTELDVILTDSLGNETELTYPADYAVSCTNNDCTGGGSIVTTATYATGNTITILRGVPLSQENNLYEGQRDLYQTFENELDKSRRIDQQQSEAITRSIKFPKTSDKSEIDMPDPAANKIIGWNAGATALENKVFTPATTMAVASQADVVTGTDNTKYVTPYAAQGMMIDEDSFASNLATKWASQQSIKAYIATQIATITGLFKNILIPDPDAADHGAAGTDTVKSLIDAIGGTERATLVFQQNGVGNTTEYNFSTTEIISGNISVIIEPGAILKDTGNIDLTIMNFIPLDNRNQCFDWDGTGNIRFALSTTTSWGPTVAYPEWWGAIPDGSTDCYAAIQSAIDSFNSLGGIVQLSRGIYHWETTVNIANGITFQGIGWKYGYAGEEATVAALQGNVNGTWIAIDTDIVAISVNAEGWRIRDFAMFWVQGTPGAAWAPTSYDAAISLKSTGGQPCRNGQIYNIMMLNPYIGIEQFDTTSIYRIHIDKIYGQPFEVGILIKKSSAPIWYNDIHFGIHWSDDRTAGSTMEEMQTSSWGIQIKDCDGHQLSNIIIENFLYGLDLQGTNAWCEFSNIYTDGCKFPVHFHADANGNKTQWQNVYCNCADWLTDPAGQITNSRGWHDEGDNATCRITNLQTQYSGEEGLVVAGTGNYYQIENLEIDSWNYDNGAHRCMSIGAGNTLYLGSQRRASNAQNGVSALFNGAGAGTILLDGEGLGTWDTGKVVDTQYTATEDGFVVCWLNCANTGARGYLQMETPTGATKSRVSAHLDTTVGVYVEDNQGTMPVANGQTWRVRKFEDVATIGTAVYWIPVNHWKHGFN